MFGREARIPVDLLVPNPPEEEHLVQSEHVGNMKKRFQETYEITRRNTKEAGQRYEDYYDAKSSDAMFQVGDNVWLFVPNVRKGKNFKLSRRWQ